MYRLKLNKEMVLRHLYYDCWVYILCCVLISAFWLCFYTFIGSPFEKKMDILLVRAYVEDSNIQELYDNLDYDRVTTHEVSTRLVIPIENIEIDISDQAISDTMKSMPHGVFIIIDEEFNKWAEKGAFMPLDEILKDFQFDKYTTELDTENFLVTSEYNGENSIYGFKTVNNLGNPTRLVIAVGKDFNYPEEILDILIALSK